MKSSTAGRDRRPSDKVAAQRMFLLIIISHFNLGDFYYTVEDQRELTRLKAEKEERRALRKKKALQKANQHAGIEIGSDDEFEQRANPSVCHTIIIIEY